MPPLAAFMASQTPFSIISTQNKDHLGIADGLCAEVFTHKETSLMALMMTEHTLPYFHKKGKAYET